MDQGQGAAAGEELQNEFIEMTGLAMPPKGVGTGTSTKKVIGPAKIVQVTTKDTSQLEGRAAGRG